MYQECDFCQLSEQCRYCGTGAPEEQCAEMLAGMVEEAREEFNSAWRDYISEYED